MSCLSPIRIKNPRYRDLSFSELDDISLDLGSWIFTKDRDNRDRRVPVDYFLSVPCGRCCECLKSYRYHWSTRLISELSLAQKRIDGRHPIFSGCYFLTLTFDEKNYERFRVEGFDNAIRLFIDRFRKFYEFRPRYFIVSELGETTGRYHFHALFFSCPNLTQDRLSALWQYGFVYLGYVTPQTCTYVTKYLLKTINPQERNSTNPFKFILRVSRGIGFGNSVKQQVYEEYQRYLEDPLHKLSININGTLYPIPRFFKRKTLTPLQCYNLFCEYFDRPKTYKIGNFFTTTDILEFKRRAAIYLHRSRVLGTSLTTSVKDPPPDSLRSVTLEDIYEFSFFRSEVLDIYRGWNLVDSADCPF